MLIAKVHETCLHSQHKPSQNSTSRWQHIMFVTPASVSCEEATTNNADAILLGIVGARKTVAPNPFLEIRDTATAAKALHCYKPQNDWLCVAFVFRLCVSWVCSIRSLWSWRLAPCSCMHEPPSDPRPELDLEKKWPREGVLISCCFQFARISLFDISSAVDFSPNMLVGPATICVYAFSGGRWASLVLSPFSRGRSAPSCAQLFTVNASWIWEGTDCPELLNPLAIPTRAMCCENLALPPLPLLCFGFCSDNRCTIKSLKMEKPCDKKLTGHALTKQADWTLWPPPWVVEQTCFSSLRGFVSICRFVPRISRSCLAFGFPCKFWKDRSHRSRTEEGKAGKVKPQTESVLVFLLHVILKWHLCIENWNMRTCIKD